MKKLKRYRTKKVVGLDQMVKCANCLYLVPDRTDYKTSQWTCRRTGRVHKCGWLSPNDGQTPHLYVCDGWRSWVTVTRQEEFC